MPAAVGSSSLALVAGVCDVAGTVGDDDPNAGRYRLQNTKFLEQQLASQRLNEIPGPPWVTCTVILAHAVLLVQLSPLKQSLTPINVPFINSIVAAKHLWQTKVSSAQHKVTNKKEQREAACIEIAANLCASRRQANTFFFTLHYFWDGRYSEAPLPPPPLRSVL